MRLHRCPTGTKGGPFLPGSSPPLGLAPWTSRQSLEPACEMPQLGGRRGVALPSVPRPARRWLHPHPRLH